ncbi:MAG: FHA domain-containing protein [Clostridia bacterium]|nr:FHA domain-containing protein [Clostridia bacterium]
MKLEKERNSIRITYRSDAPAGEILALYEKLCSAVDGMYLPSDIRKEKEGIVLNIRHRESLKVFLEKNIFSIDDYIEMLKRIKKLFADLSGAGYDPSACIWDVDAIFIGSGVSELEVVYPVLADECDTSSNSLTDLLAVTSLHVFDSRDSAIGALTDVVKSFSEWERGEAGFLLTEELFDNSIQQLSAFASGSGVLRQYAFIAINKIKKYLGAGAVKVSEKPDKGPGEVRRKTTAASLKNVSHNNKAVEKKTEILLSGQARHPHGNGRKGINGRLVDYVPDQPGVVNTADLKVENSRPVSDRIARGVTEGEKRIVLGRNTTHDLFNYISPYISREHALIICRGKKYLISDTGSVNGTLLNGERLMPGAFYRLIKGDTVSLAHKELSFHFSP